MGGSEPLVTGSKITTIPLSKSCARLCFETSVILPRQHLALYVLLYLNPKNSRYYFKSTPLPLTKRNNFSKNQTNVSYVQLLNIKITLLINIKKYTVTVLKKMIKSCSKN